MKKLGTIFTAAVLLFSSLAFATDTDKVNARVRAAFLNDFSAAADISWEKVKSCYVASFTLNNVELNAAYSDDGELIVTSREIETAQLPINISLDLAKKYEGYSFSKKALESTVDGITNYFLVVENAAQQLKLKCSTSGSIEVAQRIKKK
jgi:hypothetical protein